MSLNSISRVCLLNKFELVYYYNHMYLLYEYLRPIFIIFHARLTFELTKTSNYYVRESRIIDVS